MTEKPREEKSREIEEAARGYAYAHPRWRLLVQTILVIYPLSWILMATVFYPRKHPGHHATLAEDWPGWAISAACLVGLFALRRDVVAAVARNGWRELRRLATTEVGVTVRTEQHLHPVLGGLLGAMLGVLIPVLFFGSVIWGAYLPVRLQPLAGALALAFLHTLSYGLVWLTTRDPQSSPFRNPIRVTGTLCFLTYGLAVAAGLPQPWAQVPEMLGRVLRIPLPGFVGLLLDQIGRIIYSRREFRRLQRLVNEEGASHD